MGKVITILEEKLRGVRLPEAKLKYPPGNPEDILKHGILRILLNGLKPKLFFDMYAGNGVSLLRDNSLYFGSSVVALDMMEEEKTRDSIERKYFLYELERKNYSRLKSLVGLYSRSSEINLSCGSWKDSHKQIESVLRDNSEDSFLLFDPYKAEEYLGAEGISRFLSKNTRNMLLYLPETLSTSNSKSSVSFQAKESLCKFLVNLRFNLFVKDFSLNVKRNHNHNCTSHFYVVLGNENPEILSNIQIFYDTFLMKNPHQF